MPSDDRIPQNPSHPQSIPLQDLSRPPDERREDEGWAGSGNLSSFGTRALLGSRRAFSGRIKTHGRYERVLAGTSNEADNERFHITTPCTAHQPPSSFYEDGELSPVNLGELQTALGGLDFGPPGFQEAFTPQDRGPRLNPISEDSSTPYTAYSTPGESQDDDYFPVASDDRAPLTDSRNVEPISGSQLPEAPGQRHDRDHTRMPSSYSNRMLGDDLQDRGLAVGARRSLNRMSSLSIPSLSRSLSTSASPINTAGTMLRKMSQRVVNLSSEPEPIEPNIRRQATLDTPPSFPAMTEYAHDELPSTPAPLEKAPPLTHVGLPRHRWQQATNPLRGNTLRIFGQENKLRLWLCEVLVHPVTEPMILILILLQTVLLAVDAAGNREYNQQPSGWTGSYTDIILVVLFTIYTLEIAARIIVSGFIKNAYEYSTLPQGLTAFQATLAILRSFWMPNQEQNPASIPSMGNVYVQNSILKTFSTVRNPEEQGHGRQAQRIRLARRAFLRHSWSRIDFLAVVCFWITVGLSISGVQAGKHIFVFQMLSCLRILRLLSLTSGTSVS